jgi:hypothetical protein
MAKKPVKKAAKKAPAKKKAPVKKKSKPRKIIHVMDLTAVEPKDYLKVQQINDSTESMAEALGITEDRGQQLADAAVKAYRTTSKFSSALEVLSVECKHANELAYAVYLLADIRQHHQNPIAMLLGGMRRG